MMGDEKSALSFWKENKIFEKSVEQRKIPASAKASASKKKNFVFFEGPPGANGKPHIGHFETRVFKDIILRYKTMRGFFAPRRAGWDTHGLPVEVEVEKELGIKSKKDIEKFGIAEFNKKCRESVWKYKELWEKLTERMGFWIDMENPYITYENSYIESLWAIIKEFARKKLLYEDYKVMPWCARCGTALSSHELAQGYEKVNEESVYVKFSIIPARIRNGASNSQFSNAYFLVWTTTPWTLPGNVALAVNQDVDYVFARKGGEVMVLAEALLPKLGEGYEILKKTKGKELVGMKYNPLYPNSGPMIHDSCFMIHDANFVSTEEGTGIVHIAPAFGDDDFKLSQKYNLPVLLTASEDGAMITPNYTWDGKFFKKADKLIIDDLNSRGLLFKTELYTHDYPFCWRCKTPLMYLARKTWWVDVNKVRAKLLASNETINWLPEHIKRGRFGEWLKEEKNWAFSRERYWGTPLPVWRCGKCEKWEAAGSIDELSKRAISSGNKYILMRHGEAESNKKHVTNASLLHNTYNLTKKGEKEAEAAAKKLKKQKLKPDFILASPFLRTKKTAEIVANELGLNAQEIRLDARLAEINTGIFAEGSPEDYHKFYKNQLEKFTKKPPEGETLEDLKQRAWKVIKEAEEKYKNMTILVVSHEYSLWMLWTSFLGKSNEESVEEKEKRGEDFVRTAGFTVMKLPAIPRDENLVLDLHKPYIDNIKISCKCGGEMRRAKEVVDVWFDSGAMPWASQISAKKDPRVSAINYPADYIVEAVDQTRGWFYTLLAVATLLGKKAPYKNVISLGHVLDKSGKKMSKSLGNIVEPMALFEKYGADAVRWYFFTINQPWDPKLFKEDDIKDAQRRFFNILQNSFQFWKLYATWRSDSQIAVGPPKPNLLINKWMLAKLSDVSLNITTKLDSYDVVGAARALEHFVTEDISRWYIRRIRDIVKGGDKEAKETSSVLLYVLLETAKLLAPFAPFMAENIYRELKELAQRSSKSEVRSVHLEDWPKQNAKIKYQNVKLLEDMNETRNLVTAALEARAKANIKVRQPLNKLKIKKTKLKIGEEFLELVKGEVNIKEVEFTEQDEGVVLDTEITHELREEGILRDLIREIQAARKTAGLQPKDRISVSLALPIEMLEVAKKHEPELKKETNTKLFVFTKSGNLKVEFNKK